MENRIIERYAELNKVCRQHPKIELLSVEDRGGYVKRVKQSNIYQKPQGYAQGGFVEKFCL